jgi:SAM-dependent methyltransferase
VIGWLRSEWLVLEEVYNVIEFYRRAVLKKSCRICCSDLTNRIFKIDKMPLTDDFVYANHLGKLEYINDIEIYCCDSCGVVQNPDDFDHEAYYQDYQYSTAHSGFTQRFMHSYASELLRAFEGTNGRAVKSVLEVGSGDGQQLQQFKLLGVNSLKGVEPSEYLAQIANANGIDTEIALFGMDINERISNKYDVCVSSYTLDHVRSPLDYLAASYELLTENGILAFEIHDFDMIVQRTEYCLFEHEHTIYLGREDIDNLMRRSGFSVISINPLSSEIVRGNSLIVLAKKDKKDNCEFNTLEARKNKLPFLQDRIVSTINRIDEWIEGLPKTASLVGFGAGGRGVMTLASLSMHGRIQVLLDSNYESDKFLTPKTRIPVVGPDQWDRYKDAYCIVFSYGYYEEITKHLIQIGFDKAKIISLKDFYL